MSGGVSTRRERLVLAAILALAFALRVAFTLQSRANPYFLEPAVDQGFWVEWGLAIADGGSHGEGPFPRAPLYAYGLGALFAASGDSLLFARLAQDLLGTLGVALVYFIGRRVFGVRAAFAGALLAACSWVLIYFDNEFLRASPSGVASLFALLLAMRLEEKPGPARALTAGAVFGIAALLRPQVLAFAPVLLVWLAWRRGLRASARVLGLWSLGLTLPILPVTIYNAGVGDDLVLISPEGGTVLWNGNHPAADGVTSVPPGVRGGFREHLADQRAQAERAMGRSLSASEASHYWLERTLEHARNEPGQALALLGRKLVMFWSNWEYGNPEEPRFFARRFVPWSSWLPIGFGLLAGLALIGTITALRVRERGALLLVAFVLVYMATVVLFLVGARYRAPVVPVLAILAGGGVATIWSELRAGRRSRATAWLALVFVVWCGAQAAPAPRAASEANGLWWLALAEARAGDHAEALQLYDDALRQRSDFAYLHSARAASLLAVGRVDEARTAFARAVELDALEPSSLDALAALERQAGNLEGARALAMRSIERDPTSADPWFTLGRIEYDQGQAGAAFGAFARAFELEPEHFNAAFSYGVMALERGQLAVAIEALESVVESKRAVPDETRRRARQALAAARRGG